MKKVLKICQPKTEPKSAESKKPIKKEPPVESPTALFSSSDSELEGKLDYSSLDSLDSQRRASVKSGLCARFVPYICEVVLFNSTTSGELSYTDNVVIFELDLSDLCKMF